MKLNGWLPALLLGTVLLIFSYFYFSNKKIDSQPKTIIGFMGAPGSGKGTLSEKCIKELKYNALSTGNLLRKAIAEKTGLGKDAQKYIKDGKLVPDNLVISIVQDWLSKNLGNIETLILDGFPRTANQAELFLKLLKSKFKNVSFKVVDLEISDESIINRLSDRLICEKCQAPYSRKLLAPGTLICEICGGKLIQRADDKEDIIRNRLKEYHEHAMPLLNVYKSSDITIDQINVENKKPQEVFEEFKKTLSTKHKSSAKAQIA